MNTPPQKITNNSLRRKRTTAVELPLHYNWEIAPSKHHLILRKLDIQKKQTILNMCVKNIFLHRHTQYKPILFNAKI